MVLNNNNNSNNNNNNNNSSNNNINKNNSSSNNSNNNNHHINNNNDHFTGLFYKVIHNKYIFNNIIQQIHNNEWIVYDDIQQIKYDNRIKFKDIVSFKWMVENQQIELLKCKLEAGDPVHFEVLDYIDLIQNENDKIIVFKLILESTSIFNKDKLIFKRLHLLSPELLSIALNPPYSIPILKSTMTTVSNAEFFYNHLYNKLNNNINNNNSSDSSNSISNNMNTLLKRTRDQYEQDNINSSNSSSNNSIIISSSSSNSYNTSSFRLIKSFIASTFRNFKENSYNLYSEIYKYNGLLSIIFNNNSGSHNNNSTSSHNSNNNPTITATIYQLIPKIDIDMVIFKILSIQIQIIILDNNLYSIPDYLQQHSSEINNIINNNSNYIDNNNNNNNNSNHIDNNSDNKILKLRNLIKEKLQQQQISNSNIMDLELIIHKCLHPSLLQVENLKLLVENNKYNWKGYDFKSIGIKRGQSIDLEFIKYYLELENHEEYKYFRIKTIDIAINGTLEEEMINGDLENGSSLHQLIEYIKSIPNENQRASSLLWVNLIKRLTINKYNKDSNCEFNNQLVIMDSKTIDILDEKYNQLYENYKFTYNNYHIYNYAMDIFEVDRCYIKSISYEQFVNSINLNSNLSISQVIESICIMDKSSFDNSDDSNSSNYYINGINYSNKIKILRNLIQDEELKYIHYGLALFINETFNFIQDSGMDIETLCKLLCKSIKCSNVQTLQLILSNLIKYSNPIVYHQDKFIEIWNQLIKVKPLFLLPDSSELSQSNKDYFKLSQSNEVYIKLFKCIKLLLDYIGVSVSNLDGKIINEDNDDNGGSGSDSSQLRIEFISLFQSIVNYLFLRIIQIKSITSKQVLEAYQLINSSKLVQVYSRSTFYSVYYLSIKSTKLIKYILESPIFNRFVNQVENSYSIPYSNDINIETCQLEEEEEDILRNVFDFRNYLDPSIFSIDSVLKDSGSNGNSFDTILHQLINQLSYDIINSPDRFQELDNSDHIDDRLEFTARLFNYNLEYLMDINRHDLVLQHLEIIKSKYSNYYNSTQFQFSFGFIIQLINTGFIKPLFDHSMKLDVFNSRIEAGFVHKANQLRNRIYYESPINNLVNRIIKINNESFNYESIVLVLDIDQFELESVDESFIEFPIHLSFKLYQEYLLKYPSHQLIKPSKRLLSAAIESRSYYFIKYLLDNQLINNNQHQDDQYNQLQSYLHQQLLLNNIEFNFN